LASRVFICRLQALSRRGSARALDARPSFVDSRHLPAPRLSSSRSGDPEEFCQTVSLIVSTVAEVLARALARGPAHDDRPVSFRAGQHEGRSSSNPGCFSCGRDMRTMRSERGPAPGGAIASGAGGGRRRRGFAGRGLVLDRIGHELVTPMPWSTDLRRAFSRIGTITTVSMKHPSTTLHPPPRRSCRHLDDDAGLIVRNSPYGPVMPPTPGETDAGLDAKGRSFTPSTARKRDAFVVGSSSTADLARSPAKATLKTCAAKP